jgi:hypothetical protein
MGASTPTDQRPVNSPSAYQLTPPPPQSHPTLNHSIVPIRFKTPCASLSRPAF